MGTLYLSWETTGVGANDLLGTNPARANHVIVPSSAETGYIPQGYLARNPKPMRDGILWPTSGALGLGYLSGDGVNSGMNGAWNTTLHDRALRGGWRAHNDAGVPGSRNLRVDLPEGAGLYRVRGGVCKDTAVVPRWALHHVGAGASPGTVGAAIHSFAPAPSGGWPVADDVWMDHAGVVRTMDLDVVSEPTGVDLDLPASLWIANGLTGAGNSWSMLSWLSFEKLASSSIQLIADPVALSVLPGQPWSSTIGLVRNNHAADVALSAAGAGTGLAGLSDPTLSGAEAVSVVSGTVPANAAPGQYVVTVTGTSSGVPNAQVQITLTVPPPGANLLPDTGTLQVVPAFAASMTCTIERTGGYAGAVELVATGANGGPLSADVTGVTFTPAVVPPGVTQVQVAAGLAGTVALGATRRVQLRARPAGGSGAWDVNELDLVAVAARTATLRLGREAALGTVVRGAPTVEHPLGRPLGRGWSVTSSDEAVAPLAGRRVAGGALGQALLTPRSGPRTGPPTILTVVPAD